MRVHAFPMMPTRPCKFCFSLQDDSVFADFDADDRGQLYLVRISFDGFGCCHPRWLHEPAKLTLEHSRKLAEFTAADDPDVADVLRSYFVACGEAIWVDALKHHELI